MYSNTQCARCNEPFAFAEDMIQADGEVWHLNCFVCAQCFKPFGNDLIYFRHNGRNYCEQDFKTLYAPCCARCNQSIIGHFVRSLNNCWHHDCLICDRCRTPLWGRKAYKSTKNKPLCYDCNDYIKTLKPKNPLCHKCKSPIEDHELPGIKYKDQPHHAYHFNCTKCGIELIPDARFRNGEFYCLKCHDNLDDVPKCGSCRRPIEGRIVTALGKQWHAEHFVCAICDRPFLGTKHHELYGQAYCEDHYGQAKRLPSLSRSLQGRQPRESPSGLLRSSRESRFVCKVGSLSLARLMIKRVIRMIDDRTRRGACS